METISKLIQKIKNEKILVYCNGTHEKRFVLDIISKDSNFFIPGCYKEDKDNNKYCGIYNTCVVFISKESEEFELFNYIIDFSTFRTLYENCYPLDYIDNMKKYEIVTDKYKVVEPFTLMDIIEKARGKMYFEKIYFELTKEMFERNCPLKLEFNDCNILSFKTIKDNINWFLDAHLIIKRNRKETIRTGDVLVNKTNQEVKFCRTGEKEGMFINLTSANRYIDVVFGEPTTLTEVNKHCYYKLRKNNDNK